MKLNATHSAAALRDLSAMAARLERAGAHGFYLAAVGPRMAEVAGELANGLFIHAFSTPAYVRTVLMPAIERGLAKSGRSLAQFELCFSAFIADAAMPGSTEHARRSVAFYASTPDYCRVLEQHRFADLHPSLRQMTRDGPWDRMAAQISNEMLACSAFPVPLTKWAMPFASEGAG